MHRLIMNLDEPKFGWYAEVSTLNHRLLKTPKSKH